MYVENTVDSGSDASSPSARRTSSSRPGSCSIWIVVSIISSHSVDVFGNRPEVSAFARPLA